MVGLLSKNVREEVKCPDLVRNIKVKSQYVGGKRPVDESESSLLQDRPSEPFDSTPSQDAAQHPACATKIAYHPETDQTEYPLLNPTKKAKEKEKGDPEACLYIGKYDQYWCCALGYETTESALYIISLATNFKDEALAYGVHKAFEGFGPFLTPVKITRDKRNLATAFIQFEVVETKYLYRVEDSKRAQAEGIGITVFGRPVRINVAHCVRDILIAGLSVGTDEKTLEDRLKGFDTVEKVHVYRNSNTGRSKKCARITFKHHDDVKNNLPFLRKEFPLWQIEKQPIDFTESDLEPILDPYSVHVPVQRDHRGEAHSRSTLMKWFARFGMITRVELAWSEGPNGHAYIWFEDEASAQAAIQEDVQDSELFPPGAKVQPRELDISPFHIHSSWRLVCRTNRCRLEQQHTFKQRAHSEGPLHKTKTYLPAQKQIRTSPQTRPGVQSVPTFSNPLTPIHAPPTPPFQPQVQWIQPLPQAPLFPQQYFPSFPYSSGKEFDTHPLPTSPPSPPSQYPPHMIYRMDAYSPQSTYPRTVVPVRCYGSYPQHQIAATPVTDPLMIEMFVPVMPGYPQANPPISHMISPYTLQLQQALSSSMDGCLPVGSSHHSAPLSHSVRSNGQKKSGLDRIQVDVLVGLSQREKA
ncbi:uncharacterized protein VTP21DRAFT_5661 [Calcarisporiella thermophila]|uniref:uncharacterized protein n=1 Tax=Calcarisporiella thermophila TaxID=911321 RepID=UPI00374260E5